ncbi:MAG: hypothetical protein WC742_12485 [Gallionellaceae bacterium]|jgi:hypothetical protein
MSNEEKRSLLSGPQRIGKTDINLDNKDSMSALRDWVYQQVSDFSITTTAIDGLKLDASKLTSDLQRRISIFLHKLGCTRIKKSNGMTRYRAPARSLSGRH